MKMNYLPDKKKSLRKKFLVFIAILIAFLIFYSSVPTISQGVSSGTFYLAKPLWEIGNSISESFFEYLVAFYSKDNLLKENEALRRTIEDDNIRLLRFSDLELENEELKNLLGRTGTSTNSAILPTKVLLTAVLSGPNTFPYESLVLDSGINLGVSKGDLVISGSGVILGEIIDVYNNTSKVRLFSAYGTKTNVYAGSERTIFEALGMGSGSLRFSVPKDFLIEKGDSIIYPGLESRVLGIVGEIREEPNGSFKEIFIKPPVNVKELRFAGVVFKNK